MFRSRSRTTADSVDGEAAETRRAAPSVSAPLTGTGVDDEASRVARILEPIARELADTEALIHRKLASDVPFISRAGEYLFDAGGKRMRPALLLLSARMLDRLGPEAVTYAAVVEFIHSATLIHDDIIDHAELRRGRRTVHTLWGSNLTVLLGDWLYTTAMRMALEHDNLPVIDLFCEATLRMTEGELLVLERLGNIGLSVDDYFGIIDRKTAALFAAACAAPALIRPSDEGHRDALSRFGRALGICFQLVDDMLDFTAKEGDLGKPVLSDLREGKLTLPVLLALPRIPESERAAIGIVLEDRDFHRVEPERILEIVRREGTLEETGTTARSWADRALEALSALPDGAAREALASAPSYVLYRHV